MVRARVGHVFKGRGTPRPPFAPSPEKQPLLSCLLCMCV